MYQEHFGLSEKPFSIAPDPRFLFMSQRHKEALAHLLYGIGEGGGFVQLTGEVGTGKTTLCRGLLEQLPESVDVALILNPKLTALELVATVCDELKIPYDEGNTSVKLLIDRLNAHLLKSHSAARRTVLVIDEAQNLSIEVLEQIRLLTNLETNTEKLLQVILIGQPELSDLLSRHELRQIAQRITARYHLGPLNRNECREYIRHRLRLAGGNTRLFKDSAAHEVFRRSGGIPRVINILCDRALLGTYVEEGTQVERKVVRRAAREVRSQGERRGLSLPRLMVGAVALLIGVGLVAIVWQQRSDTYAWLPAWASVKSLVSGDSVPMSTPQARPNQGPGFAASDYVLLGETGKQLLVVQAAATKPVTAATGQGRAGNHPGNTDSQRLAPVLAQSTLESSTVWNKMFGLWGIDEPAATSESICEKATLRGLRCISGNANWQRLRDLDRPAILYLNTEQGQKVPALLMSLAESQARLFLDAGAFTIPVPEVDRYWTRDFLILWRPPVAVSRLQLGDRGPAVSWLRQQLDASLGQGPEPLDPEVFDNPLVERLRRFQGIRGLSEDGVAGSNTLIHLNTLDSPARVPRLKAGGA